MLDESGRLAALRAFGAFDPSPDPVLDTVFDRIAALAADLLDMPVGVVTLVDETRIRLRGRFGTTLDGLPRAHLLWPGAVDAAEPLTVAIPDTAADPRTRGHPAVVGAPHAAFYAAAALVTPDGWRLGTVAALGPVPAPPPPQRALDRLAALAAMAVDELRLRGAHRAALASERLLRLAEGLAGVGHWRSDVATGTMTWSDEVYRIHGMDKEAGPPRLSDVRDLYAPEDRYTIARHLSDTAAGRGGFEAELRIQRRDGTRRRVMAKTVCECDETGRPTALFGVMRDVTEQAAVVEALRDSEARYRLLAEQATDIIVSIDLKGRIGFVSPAVEAVAGRSPADLVGTAGIDFVHPDDRPSFLRHLLTMRRRRLQHSPRAVEFRARHADGRWIWLEAKPTQVIDPVSGDTTGWVDIVRDIGIRKAQAIELASARRTAEQAARTAVETARAKADFLANMSHEIRTPLNSIIGFTQVLKRDGTLGDVQRAQVERVEDAGRSLLTVVNEVLELSKLESGAVRIERRRFSPARLARDTAALIRPQASDKGLQLVVEIAPDATATALGDPGRLRQVLLNLLSNAVKFTAAGEVRLKLRAEAVGATLDLRIAVEDSGIGIAQAQLPNLFHRYAQANGTIARRFGGTGLGLAISKRLIEEMGGTIVVESAVKVGSRFLVSLVLPLAERDGASGAGRPASGERARLDGLSILVAEDVPANQRLIEAMLAPFGCRVEVVANGAEALAAVQRSPYDVVLMDMEMPVLDGVAATRAIRALGGIFATLPVAALTANVFPEQRARAREAGMDEVVTKPIDADRLARTVAALAVARPRQLAD